jgi:hypothetical protein
MLKVRSSSTLPHIVAVGMRQIIAAKRGFGRERLEIGLGRLEIPHGRRPFG